MARQLEDKIAAYKIVFVPNILVSCANIVSNSILVHALRRRNKVRVITFKLIYILSISDILNAISILSGDILIEMAASRKEYYSTVKSIVNVLQYPLLAFSVLMILLTAVDRYLHMTKMNNYSQIMTHSRANKLVFYCALSAFIDACVTGASYYLNFYEEFVTFLCVFGLVCILLSFGLYYKALRSITVRVDNASFSEENRNVRNAGKEVSRAVFFIFACLALTMTPTFILLPVRLYMPQKSTYTALYTMNALFYFNSTLNAVIIIYFSRDLRSCVRQILNCKTN